MKKMFQTMWLLGVLVLIAACGDHSRFKYESVPGDPLNARIYFRQWLKGVYDGQ